MPAPFAIRDKLGGEERRPLRPRPVVPVARRYQEGSMTRFLPLFVVLRNFDQATIFVEAIGNDEYASLGWALGIHRVARRDTKPKSR